jgi:hypothetical protein
MAHLKVSCQQCPEYGKCSTRTRLFVNYCGSRTDTVADHIREAAIECRSHGGRHFKRHVLSSFYLKGVQQPDLSLTSA